MSTGLVVSQFVNASSCIFTENKNMNFEGHRKQCFGVLKDIGRRVCFFWFIFFYLFMCVWTWRVAESMGSQPTNLTLTLSLHLLPLPSDLPSSTSRSSSPASLSLSLSKTWNLSPRLTEFWVLSLPLCFLHHGALSPGDVPVHLALDRHRHAICLHPQWSLLTEKERKEKKDGPQNQSLISNHPALTEGSHQPLSPHT